jgi:hypothetical protein
MFSSLPHPFAVTGHGARRAPSAAPELLEVITPRTNHAVITPAENLFANLSPLAAAEPFSLEIAAMRNARWFVVRAAGPVARTHVEQQLGAAYPQASFRPLDPATFRGHDPARVLPDEVAAACTLTLRAPAYLPLRTFGDGEIVAARAAQADPVLGLLAALGNVPDGWRALSQLVLRPAPPSWCKGYVRMAVDHPLAAERTAAVAGGPSLLQVALLGGLLAAGAAGFQAYAWYRAQDWLHLAELVGGAAALPALWLLARRAGLFRGRPIYDAKLVQEKISRPAYHAQLRLAVFAPQAVPLHEVEQRLARIVAAYQQYGLASGNGFLPRRLRLAPEDSRGADALTTLRFLPPVAGTPVLNTRELAGLWHLPQAEDDVPLVERTTARERLPLPSTVASGCRIGVSAHQGRSVPVSLPDALLRRHLLLAGKTRKGKSSLLTHVARYLMDAERPAAARPAVVLVDPHRDLARSVLGTVPRARHGDVVFLDVGERERPFGFNLLDVGLGWSKDRAVANALVVFKREFDEFWGPRMEDAFRFALLTLFEANQRLCETPGGRERQHTVLEVPALMADPDFRSVVLRSVKDPVVRAWWFTYFLPLDRKLQLEIVNPVQTKIQRYAGSEVARNIIGQPRSTIDPREWVRGRRVVLIDTAKSAVGEDTAALVGASLINLVALAVAEQGTLPERERRPVTLLIDEMQTMPGADYESILSELAKYGASIVLSTQSLARLDALDREQGRALRPTVFSNVDGLFAFQVSAGDAEYLAQELGGGLDPQDVLELGDYHCYARLSVGGERLPAFSVQLDPPPTSDPAVAATLAEQSAERYGRDREDVEQDLRDALARIELARARRTGFDPTEAAGDEDETNSTSRRQRSQNRPRKRPRHSTEQPPLLGDGNAAAQVSDPADGDPADGEAA